MTLSFSTQFPDGTPTLFPEKIMLGYDATLSEQYPDLLPKIHTFRLGERWKEGMKLHLVTGNRTPQRAQFGQDISELEHCHGVQTCIIRTVNIPMQAIAIEIDGREVDPLLFAANDGFNSLDQCFQWFAHPFKPTHHDGQIVHFSDFRY